VPKYPFLISFFSTALLYLSLGILFFYLQHLYIGAEQKPQEKTISFSLASYEPEMIPPVELPVEEPVKEPVVEPIKEEEPLVEEVEPEELVVEKVIPEPIIKKIITKKIVDQNITKPKPVVKKIVKKKVAKKKVIKKKRVKKKSTKKKSTKKKVTKRKTTTKKASSKKKASPAKKNAFLSRIRSKINKNKTYPRIAQRRGMQGSVKVKFTILSNGKVGNISVSGSKVFHKSAKSAVKNAFPISARNAPVSLPMTVNFTLRYQIR